MKLTDLTERQLWFIQSAIDVNWAVLPIQPNQLDANIFESDYGISQKEMEKEIDNLRTIISQAEIEKTKVQ